MKSSTPTLLVFADLPKDYRALCMDVLLPRPIHTRDGYRAAMAVVEAMAGHDLSKDQDDYLEALTTFVGEWETAHEAKLPKVTPLELLSFLLAENGLRGSDLAQILGTSRSLASRLLSGERQLTAAHIRTLCTRFQLNPAAFIQH